MKNSMELLAVTAMLTTLGGGTCGFQGLSTRRDRDVVSNVDLVHFLTNESRYDRHQRPRHQHSAAPVNVTARVHVYLMECEEGRLSMHARLNLLLQLRFLDPRLQYVALSPGTRQLIGGLELLHQLWTPHVFLANELSSLFMPSGRAKDVLVRVLPDGQVVVSTRLTVTVRCAMKHGRFPFDEQECPVMLESWTDVEENLQLLWEAGSRPVRYSRDLSLASFRLEDLKYGTAVRGRLRDRDELDANSLTDNKYSALTITFTLARLNGYYIMNFYMPSILLVVMSWVSFWLGPNMVPARVLLGSSTMLTFITLAVDTDLHLPVSYVKASEVWFVGCCTFIFGSLVEFALVNTIWRQGQSVELRKVTTRHILRSTLGTPAPRRLLPQERYARRRRTSSLPDVGDLSLQAPTRRQSQLRTGPRPQRTVAFQEEGPRPRLPPQVAGTRRQSLSAGLRARLARSRSSLASFSPVGGWTRMSASQVADWIDSRSRVCFPLAFFVFNCVYWTTTAWF